MLEKIEAAYLAVMRVIVLIAATLAIVVCAVGATYAAPEILRQLGGGGASKLSDEANLSKFIEEQRAAGMAADAPTSGSDAAQVVLIPGKVARAANLIADYVEAQHKIQIDRPALQKVLKEKRDTVDTAYQLAYDDSLLRMAEDLKASTGRPLPFERVTQLIDWHFDRFQQSIVARKEETLALATKAQAGMMLAGGGLAAFLLILFFFLFVKIERNLRLVRTHEVVSP